MVLPATALGRLAMEKLAMGMLATAIATGP
jgi:hypothetical protein